MRTHNRRPARATQRGAAALLVVVVLFFILALVTAYAGRNLIFEQRTSVNNMRANQAFEAAEAGLEFAVAHLAGGRINAACDLRGIPYHRFINGLRKAKVDLNRKALAELALSEPKAFDELVETAKKALAATPAAPAKK